MAINPATPAGMVEEILPDLELLLVMTVNPGFGGQQFIAGTLPKLRRARQMIDLVRPGCELEVDGGIEPHTIASVVEAGATVLVAGSAIFGAPGGAAEGVAAQDRIVGRRGTPTRSSGLQRGPDRRRKPASGARLADPSRIR